MYRIKSVPNVASYNVAICLIWNWNAFHKGELNGCRNLI